MHAPVKITCTDLISQWTDCHWVRVRNESILVLSLSYLGGVYLLIGYLRKAICSAERI